MLRTILRYALTAVAGVLLALAYFTVETAADEAGYTDFIRRVVRGGWSAMVDAGYSEWVISLATFFSGGAIALWADHWIRGKPKQVPAEVSAGIYFKVGDSRFESVRIENTYNTHSWYCLSGAQLFLFIVFEREIADGHIAVLTTAEDIEWLEHYITGRSCLVEVTGDYTNAHTMIQVTAASISPGRRQQPNVKQKPVHLTEIDFMTYVNNAWRFVERK